MIHGVKVDAASCGISWRETTMKKILIAALVLGLAFAANGAMAKSKSGDGGLELSGHMVTGMGFQYQSNKTPTYFTNDGDAGYYAGPMGKYLNKVPFPKSKHFAFFMDEVELDLTKSFGENVRLRADLDFARGNSTGITNVLTVEQAYATANIPVGNGIEFLIGRFNAPIGFEAVDVSDNDTFSKSVIATGLRPTNLTGAKIYYPFSDLVDLHFYVVNKLDQDTMIKANSIPSAGLRLGFNWGEEGTESTIGVSGFFGPKYNYRSKRYTFGGDVDANWWATEAFAIGFEGIYRHDQADNRFAAATAVNYFGALVNLHYVFSDVWDGTLKYAMAKQSKGSSDAGAQDAINAGLENPANPYNLTGTQQWVHQIALAGGYGIADGAKLKMEGRFDIVKPVGSGTTEYVYGAVVGFDYNF